MQRGRTVRQKAGNGIKWAATIVLRNEEDNVDGVIASLMNQSVKPSAIFAFDDGSTDRTGKMLDGMEGVTVTHGTPHPPQHSHSDFIARRFNLMKAALPGMDYVLNIDADMRLERKYMERITRRMKRDGATVASGMDPGRYTMSPTEQGIVIDAKWAMGLQRLHPCALNFLWAEAVEDGRPCAVYHDIEIGTLRTLGSNYGPNVERLRGANQRQRGLAWHWALYTLVRGHRWSWWLGFVSYKGQRLPAYHGKWYNALLAAQKKRRFGLKQDMIMDGDSATYLVPGSRHGR